VLAAWFRREEVPATVPVPLVTSDQAQIGLVDQRRGVERLARPLPRQLLRRQFAEFVVDQRQELLGGGRVAWFDGGQEVSDFAHAVQDNHPDGVATSNGPARWSGAGPERFRGPSEPPAERFETLSGCDRDSSVNPFGSLNPRVGEFVTEIFGTRS
jgi:hypothetical protein